MACGLLTSPHNGLPALRAHRTELNPQPNIVLLRHVVHKASWTTWCNSLIATAVLFVCGCCVDFGSPAWQDMPEMHNKTLVLGIPYKDSRRSTNDMFDDWCLVMMMVME